jgi:alpha-beta hydrolase superfamily lysophospholipase
MFMKIVKTVTKDGLLLNGLLSEPLGEKKVAVIHVHGMAGSIVLEEYYQVMHDRFPENKIAFLAGENRGLGTVTEFKKNGDEIILVGNAYEKFEDSILDIQAWIDFITSLGYSDIWLQGHSLGCSKIAYFLKENDHKNIKGLIMLSPADMIGMTIVDDEERNFQKMVDEATVLVQNKEGKTLLSNKLWGSELLSAGTLLNMFGEKSNAAIFNFNDESLGWKTANTINLPVLAITGTNDDGIVPVMDPYEAMNKLKSELKNSPRINTIVYDGAKHSFDGFGDMVVSDILEFIG